MIFELFCYACAIVTVLAFYGSKNLQPIAVAAQPEPEQQLQDESSAQAPDLFVEPEQTPEE